MQKFIMLAGPSGSGKSTYAQRLWADINGDSHGEICGIVSSDKIRELLYGDESDQTDHQRVFDKAHMTIAGHLDRGKTVIFDATNLQQKFRAAALNPAAQRGVVRELHYLVTPGHYCMERLATRERKVPQEVVWRQLNQRERDMERGLHEFYEEGFSVVRFVEQ